MPRKTVFEQPFRGLRAGLAEATENSPMPFEMCCSFSAVFSALSLDMLGGSCPRAKEYGETRLLG
jgi:hypothetical protein